jgi:hypothetical protein
MKKLLLQFCLLLTLATATTVCFGQNKLSIDNVRTAYIRNSGEILDGEELKGYFTFYVSDKISKKVNQYTVQILDNNLNKIKDIVFEDDKNVEILESSYNGNSIMFLFFNDKERTLEYRAYGYDGKVKHTYTKELNKRSSNLIEYTYGHKSEEGQNEALFSVDKRGFATVFPVKEGKYYSYEVNYFGTEQKTQWSFEAAEEQEDKWSSAVYLGASEKTLFFEVVKQKRLMGGTPHSWLLGLDIATGKKTFEIITEAEDYKFYPMNITKINGTDNMLLLGTYYDADAKIAKDASLGLAAWTIDNSGKVTAKKYNSWQNDIGKYLTLDKKGRVGNVGYIYFHKILQTSDGNFFAVGEGYQKVVSGAGVALNALSMLSGGGGSNISNFKIKITDMVTLQFSPKFEIKNAQVYDKNNSSVELPAGAGYLSPHTMALLVKSWRGFDYDFTQTNKEHTRVSVGYSNYERSKEYKGQTFNAITYDNGKTTTDKIELASKARWLRVFSAKAGFIMIMEYFKKEQKLEMRLEKLN